MNRNSKKWPCLAIALAALFAAGFITETARAQDAAATNTPPKPHWESVASADATLTRGNSKTFLGTITINTARKSASDEILLGGSAGYGETTTKQSNGSELTTETADYLRGFSQWNHLFTDRFYAGIRFEAVHDNIADINYRLTVSPLAGYYFIKHTNTFLSMELGPSYVYEQIGGKTLSYAAVRVGERYEYKFKTGARIWENAEWYPQVDRFKNWILNAELGVSAPITKAVDARLVLQDTYNNQPAPGLLKNDLKLLAGIGYRF